MKLHERRWTSNAMLAGGAAIGFNAAARVREAGMALPFPRQYDQRFSKIQLLPDRLSQPLRWRKPRTVAVCFMGDLWHPDVPDEFIERVLAVTWVARLHRYLFLTKRAERMHAFFQDSPKRIYNIGLRGEEIAGRDMPSMIWPLPNVWLGVTAENQRMADKRIPPLLKTPAAHRWASIEPLLERVDIAQYIETLPGLDACVVGGESGPGYREMAMPWVERLSVQCDVARVPYYGKQRAATRPGQPLPGYLGRKELPW
jgi:protein gp37